MVSKNQDEIKKHYEKLAKLTDSLILIARPKGDNGNVVAMHGRGSDLIAMIASSINADTDLGDVVRDAVVAETFVSGLGNAEAIEFDEALKKGSKVKN